MPRTRKIIFAPVFRGQFIANRDPRPLSCRNEKVLASLAGAPPALPAREMGQGGAIEGGLAAGHFVALHPNVRNFGKQDLDFHFLRLTAPVQAALRGMEALAAFGKERRFQEVADAANLAGLPAESLAKVFQRLARRGLLSSRRGPGGGYALSRPAKEITLAEIARAADDGGPVARICALGGRLCGPRGCLIHSDVRRADDILASSLIALTLEDLVRHQSSLNGEER